ncbi:DUF1777-domain-containing protein [Lentinus brumalis]|uniref:DUF1777-domain-containing protein n=1 Tax=Lentinus brumalis TaxID=2498619 RepID=A0A371DW30_9APHY|nr:DUF1777-domain-containing protein [Polyporus brumalis]
MVGASESGLDTGVAGGAVPEARHDEGREIGVLQTAQTTTLVTGVKIAEIGGTTDETTGDGTTVTAETMTEMDGATLHPHLEVTQTETGTVAPLAAQRDKQQTPTGTPDHEPSASRPREDSEVPTEDVEEGEAMDASNEDDAAMMAIMGLTGFGTTKGKHVDGNQEGGVDVKKQRTWRQYMNRYVFRSWSSAITSLISDRPLQICRRGGFNRPLDKIK